MSSWIIMVTECDHWPLPDAFFYGPLARYLKLRVSHASGMLGTFSPPPPISDPDMHHGTCGTHMPWCMPGSLPSVFLRSRWRGKRSRHFRCMRNPQFYVSGKRPIVPHKKSSLNEGGVLKACQLRCHCQFMFMCQTNYISSISSGCFCRPEIEFRFDSGTVMISYELILGNVIHIKWLAGDDCLWKRG